MLCTFSFISSICSIVAATVVLYQVAVSDQKGYSKIAYHVALIFFFTTLLTVGGAALEGALSFLQFKLEEWNPIQIWIWNLDNCSSRD